MGENLREPGATLNAPKESVSAGPARRAAELAAILESIGDAVYIGDAQGITFANQPALDQLGFRTPEELRRQVGVLAREIDTRDADTGAPISAADQPFTRALNGERVAREVRVRHRLTGQERILRSSASPVVLEGEIVGAVAVNTDITEQKLAEAALRESEERLRLAVEIGELASWDWNLETGEVAWNDRHHLMQGYEVGKVTPSYEAWISRIHPDDRAEATRRIERARDRHETYTHEFRALQPDGSVGWRSARGRFFYDDRGEPLRMIGVIEDITERKRVVDQLAASEARLRLALDAGRMAAFEWPLNVPEPPLSDPLREQLAVAADSTLAERRARYHPDDAALVTDTRRRALSGQERFIDFDFRYLRPDDHMRWLQVRSEVLRDTTGAPQRLIGVQLDITDRRENEERLRLLMQEVDHRAKNVLFVVQAMVALTNAPDLEAYRAALLGRVDALSRAHQLLSEARWTGADLGRLAADELRPYGQGGGGEDGDWIRLQGPSVSLSPAQAQAIALCLHELATNAAKYGALSVPEGRLALEWRVGGGRIEMTWIERGGPPVAKPAQTGFGCVLLSRSLGGQLGGEVKLEWAQSGLTARLSLPSAPLA